MPTVVIAAGGTAGHVVPALAVADELRASGADVVWVGTRDRAEARLVPAAVALPRIKRRRIWLFGLLFLGGLLAPDPAVPDAAIVATILATCLGLAVRDES